jgi:hypothetical protein
MDKYKICAEGTALCVIAGTFLKWLPEFAAAASLIYYVIMTYFLWKEKNKK